MMARKSKGRQKFLGLAIVSPINVPDDINRAEWLQAVSEGFVATSNANKAYYRVLLEKLWPLGHGIPGPRITEGELREAVDEYRRSQHQGDKPYKPYVDVFRRLRELQGEEGIIGIGRSEKVYQLVSLKLGKKRIPRIKLTDSEWQIVLEKYGCKCSVCRRQEPEIRLQQDHKVPRIRGGDNKLSNWQPLCDECNNFKSVSCRGCTLDCSKCSWAYPENHAPLRLSSRNITRIREYALEKNENPHDLLNRAVTAFLDQL